MSEPVDRSTLNQLLNCPPQCCLSLYMPTYRAFPDSTQNAIRYKNLLATLSEQLRARYPDANHAALLEPFERLEEEHEFWLTPRDGLVVLGGEQFFHVHKLMRAVPEQTHVGDRPCLAPLLQITQAGDAYQALCLSRDEVRLFEGTQEAFHEVQLDYRVPKSQTDALGSDLTAADQSGHPDGFGAAGERGDPLMHSAGGSGKQDEIDKDRDKFFRAVDVAIERYHSRPSGLPLMLVALPDNQSAFRSTSRNAQLTGDRIEVDPGTLNAEALRKQAAELMARNQLERLNALHDRYGVAQGEGRSSTDLDEVGKAAVAGRIELLLVAAQQSVGGLLDPESGALERQSGEDANNLLDDITTTAMRNGAEVMIVPAQRMPSGSPVAAVFYA